MCACLIVTQHTSYTVVACTWILHLFLICMTTDLIVISLYRLRLAAIGHAKPSHVHPALHDGKWTYNETIV